MIERDNQTLLKASNLETAACTIITKSYLPYARVLFDSFEKYHPHSEFFVLIVDTIDGYFKPEEEGFTVARLEELEIPDLNAFCFRYAVWELSTAIKPYLLSFLFSKYGFKKMVYLDADILVLRGLQPLFGLLDQYSIVLTPHLTAPIEEDGCRPTEINILQSGTYNLGFVAVANTQTTREFLVWWGKRLYDKCLVDIEKGMHADQKWVDLVPGFFEDVCILREPGYNVGFWNLNSRKAEIKDGEWFVNGRPCYFFHFSGLQLDDIKHVSQHQNRFTLNKLGPFQSLFGHYRDLLLAKGYQQTRNWPYNFKYFDNGAEIPSAARRLYLSLGRAANRFGNPFRTDSGASYFHYLNDGIDGEKATSRIITRLWYEIYQLRPDVRLAFPDIIKTNREDFIRWVINSGKLEYNLDERFIAHQIGHHECVDKQGSNKVGFGRGLPRRCRRFLGSALTSILKTRLSKRLYRSFLRPLEPGLEPIIASTLGRNKWIWARLKGIRQRLREGLPNR